MNEDIRNFIASYRGMVDTYRPKVAPGSAKLKETEEYLRSMEALGGKCKDIGEFLTKVQEQDMMNRMTALMSDLAVEGLKAQQAAGQVREPSVADAALAYHKAYEAIEEKQKMPETCRVYERVFQIEKESSHAGQFVRRLAEEGLFTKMATAPLVEKFRPLVAQADGLSIPVMAVHNSLMLEMAEKAKSSIEVEYESNRLLELNRMELVADEHLANDLVYTLGGPISGYLLSPTEENRQRVENAYRFVAEFFGVDDGELYAIPRVYDLIDKIIIPMLNKNGEGKHFTREGFIAEQKQVIAACLKGKPSVAKGPASRRKAVLWGREVPLEQMLDALRNPPRPKELSQ